MARTTKPALKSVPKPEAKSKAKPHVEYQTDLIKLPKLSPTERVGRGPSLDHLPLLQKIMSQGPQNAEAGEHFYPVAVFGSKNGASTAASNFRTGKRPLPDGTEPEHWVWRALDHADGEQSVLAVCYVGAKVEKK